MFQSRFHILQICKEWGMRPDEFDAMPAHYRAEVLAFIAVESWRVEEDAEDRKRKAKLK